MTYSCADFTDNVLHALGIVVPEESRESPLDQAELARTEITRLQRFERETRYALLVLDDTADPGRFVARVRNIAESNAGAIETMKVFIAMEGGICQSVSTDDPNLVGAEYVVIDYDVEGADSTDVTEVIQTDGDIAEAVIGGGTIDALGVKILELETAR